MTGRAQAEDIAELPFSEQVRLIISEQFTFMRCLARPSAISGDGFVDCDLPNCSFRMISGKTKRIKKTIINVPLGYVNGAQLVFPDDGIHGILLCSNYPSHEIETATIADLSCVNVYGGKCLFIPAAYEGEFAKELLQKATEKYTIEAPKISIGNGLDAEIVTLEANQYNILLTYFAAITANIAGVAAADQMSITNIVTAGNNAAALLTTDLALTNSLQVL